MTSVGIIYGWLEGPWQGKRLRAALQQAGYHVTKSLSEADILIAHSGGCFLLPDESRANLVMLVGLPYWPDKHIFRSLQQKVRSEIKNLWWLQKSFFNTYYFVTQPLRWIRMWRAWRQFKIPSHEDASVILLRNKRDHFLHPTEARALADSRRWKLKLLEGQHDDLWHNPEPYVQAIKQAYRKAQNA